MNVRDLVDVKRKTLTSPSGLERCLFDEEAFDVAVGLERKRSERSRRCFVLMLLDVGRMLENDRSGQALTTALSAISQSIRDIDVIGWRQTQSVLGIIFTEISCEARKSIASTMFLKMTGVLYRSLTFEQFSEISISSHVYPEQWQMDLPQRPSNQTLYPDLSRRERKSKLFHSVKRGMDIFGSLCGLLVCAPLFLLIAVAIKLSSQGPVLFRQQRVGQYGAPFTFLKFRSMYSGNDCAAHRDYVHDLINGTDRQQDQGRKSGGLYKIKNDPRVTRIGKFLRKTSLDELPQLYNVLHGEMSLVGPRPAIPYEVEAYHPWHQRRVLEAKPGITGLWQVEGRSRVGFDEMVRLDVRYATTCSLWLDLKILFRTPCAVLLGEGAC